MMLDIAGFRERHRKELQALATEVIVHVQTTGEAQRLAPMNPFERKVIHDVVAKVEGVHSESEGEEKQRCVVISKLDES